MVQIIKWIAAAAMFILMLGSTLAFAFPISTVYVGDEGGGGSSYWNRTGTLLSPTTPLDTVAIYGEDEDVVLDLAGIKNDW